MEVKKTFCDTCEKNIADVVDAPGDGYVIALIVIHPDLNNPLHFCGSECFKNFPAVES